MKWIRRQALALALAFALAPACITVSQAPVETPDGGGGGGGEEDAADRTGGEEADVGPVCGPADDYCSALTHVRKCAGGQWLEPEGCGDGAFCDGGQCRDRFSCQELFECWVVCELERTLQNEIVTCQGDCLDRAADSATASFNVAYECYDGEGCLGEPQPLTCLGEECGEELAQCVYTASGEQSCAELLTAVGPCGDDLQCSQGAVEQGTVEAQAQFLLLSLCLSESCQSFGGAANCSTDECVEELIDCAYPEHGDETCLELLGCVIECEPECRQEGDPAACSAGCQAECVEDGSHQAKVQYLELFICAAEACADDGSPTCYGATMGRAGDCNDQAKACCPGPLGCLGL